MQALSACVLALSLSACAPGEPAPGSTPEPVWTLTNWRTACRYDTALLPELSGMAPSVRHPGILWAINDGGNADVLYALDTGTCEVRGQHTLTTVTADSEALASGRDPAGRPVLWVGDIGDNLSRREKVAVLELPEPALGATSGSATVHRFTYPGGPRDAEGLMPGPDGKSVFVVSKQLPRSTVYRVPLRAGTARAVALGKAPALVTDAALNPRTGDYALRDYLRIVRYRGPVTGPRLGSSTPPALRQAEALAFSRGGRHLFTAAEGDPRLLQADVTTANGNRFQ
jgi:hypothetical protein